MQIEVILGALLMVLAIGGIAALLAIRYSNEFRITLGEFAGVAIIAGLIVAPLTDLAATHIAQASTEDGFVEFLNGSIVSADVGRVTCDRDGSCQHHHDCDEYVTFDMVGSGKNTHLKTHHHHHECPYATEEDTYTLTDSFGDVHTVAEADRFTTSPQTWRDGDALPGDVPRGPPGYWLQAKAHLDAGDPDGVTKTHEYTNYILASTDTLLKRSSTNIARYQAKKLLPPHTRNLDQPVDGLGRAGKVQFVGIKPLVSQDVWEAQLARLNAALGKERQGDMHVVIVKASQIDDSEGYINALVAYWQSDAFDKNAFAKNGIALVLGVDDSAQNVVWARAKTGMPEGNNEMLQALSFDLPKTAFTPDAIFGDVHGKIVQSKMKYDHGTGSVARIVLDEFPFARACMNCITTGDKGQSYVYLTSEWELSTGGEVVTGFLIILLSSVMWVLAILYDLFAVFRKPRSYYS